MLLNFRMLFGLLGATVVTFGLFSLMHGLIASSGLNLDDKPAFRIADIIMPERQIEVQQVKEEVVKPDNPDEAPPDIPDMMEQDFDFDVDSSQSFGYGFEHDINISAGASLSANEGEYLPIVKVAPLYPSVAQRRGIEGYCLVEYTVSHLGTVLEPKPLDCNPSGMFERASVKAARKFKYKPRVVDGKPIAVTGVRNLFTYKIDGK